MAQKIRRSVFIGLGGTGMKTIVRTKSVLMDNYGKNGEIPPLFAFVGIDTDSAEYDNKTNSHKSGKVSLSARERLSISVARPIEFFQQHKREYKWLPSMNELFINTLDRGAGQIRTNGRLAFFYNRERLKERIRTALVDVNSSEKDDAKWSDFEPLEGGVDGVAKTEIHVIFSLSGGTGCGTFLDVAYLIREVARQNNYQVTINGYGVLPGVFQEEIRDPGAKSRIKSNAYGALCDLDYLMCLDQNGAYKISWQDQETYDMPFDSVVLVDNKNSEGICYKKMSDLTEMLSMALLSATGEMSNVSKSVGDNVKNDMLMKTYDVKDKRAWVSAIGTAAIVYDSANVAEVYRLKAQNKLIDQLLSTSQDANLVANAWIDDVRIRENNGKDQVIDALYEIADITPFSLSEDDFDKKNVVERVQEKYGNYQSSMIPSAREWNEKVDNMFEATKNSLVEKLQELCKQSVQDPKAFLQNVRTQIATSFLAEMSDEKGHLEDDRKAYEADFTSNVEMLKAYLNSGWIHRKTDNYIQTIKSSALNLITAEVEIKRRSYAIEFYNKLIVAIDGELQKLTETIGKLLSLKDENDSDVCRIQNSCGNTKTVEIDLAEDVIKTITVGEDHQVILSGLIDMMPGKTMYLPSTKEVYKVVLDDYTMNLKACEDFKSQTIDHILNGLTKDQFEEIIKRAANRSMPFLSINDHGCQVNGLALGVQEVYYICVPDAATCRLTKDNYYRDIISAENAEVLSTGLADRIIIYRMKRPVPALAIGGLETYQLDYDKDCSRVFFHIDDVLYKKMQENGASFQPKDSSRDEALEAWVMGCVLGLIKFDKKYYFWDDEVESATGDEPWVDAESPYRDIAFKKFCENPHLFKQYQDKFVAHIDEIGSKAAAELCEDVVKNYFRKYSRCQLTSKTISSSREYAETEKLILQEQRIKESIFNVK